MAQLIFTESIFRAPSPPLKKPRLEEKGKIPDLLQGEIARLDRRFKVKLDPMRHTGQKDVHLVCKLGRFPVLKSSF